MAINTGPNSGDKAKKSTPVYHGGKPGQLGFPQKSKPAPHPSNQTGAGNTNTPKKG